MENSNIEIDSFKTKLLEKFNDLEKLLIEGKERKDFESLLHVVICNLKNLQKESDNNESYDEIINRHKIIYSDDRNARHMAHRYIAEQLRTLAANLEQGKGPGICTALIPKKFYLEDFKNGPFIECSVMLSYPWGA